MLRSLIVAARELDLWPSLLPLVPLLRPPALTRVAESIRGLNLDEVELDRLAAAKDDPALRPGLSVLARTAGLEQRLGVSAEVV